MLQLHLSDRQFYCLLRVRLILETLRYNSIYKSTKLWAEHYKVSHMAWLLLCHGMCKNLWQYHPLRQNFHRILIMTEKSACKMGLGYEKLFWELTIHNKSQHRSISIQTMQTWRLNILANSIHTLTTSMCRASLRAWSMADFLSASLEQNMIQLKPFITWSISIEVLIRDTP